LRQLRIALQSAAQFRGEMVCLFRAALPDDSRIHGLIMTGQAGDGGRQPPPRRLAPQEID
jgi:hypothetical protein